MSEPINDGGPAYPVEFFVGECRAQNSTGMSLRDYFAAKALSGLATKKIPDEDSTAKADMTLMAKDAYYIADAMLSERSKLK